MNYLLIGRYKKNPSEAMEVITSSLFNNISKTESIKTLTTPKAFLNFIFLCFRPYEKIIFSHGPAKGVVILTFLFSIFSKSKIIWIASRPNLSSFIIFFFNYLKVDLIIANKSYPWIKKILNNYETKVHLLPIGVDFERLNFNKKKSKTFKINFCSKHNIDPKKPIFLHVGHAKKNRGYETLIRVKKALGEQINFIFVLSDSGSIKSDKKIINHLQKEKIKVIDEYFKEIGLLYSISDLYLFPASDEQGGAVEFPLSVLEALICGSTVLSSKFGSLEFYLNSLKGIFFTDKKNFPDFASKLVKKNYFPSPSREIYKLIDDKKIVNIIKDF